MNTTKRLIDMSLSYALLVVGAYIQISLPTPFFVMHITLQWLMALVIGSWLKPKDALMVYTIYVLSGLFGLPVFASGGGPTYLLLPTFGYIIGILLGGYYWSNHQHDRMDKPNTSMIDILISLLIYYGCGILYYIIAVSLWLDQPIPWYWILLNGFLITIIPDYLLAILARIIERRIIHHYQK